MTTEEHALMIGVLALQWELVQALAQILESREIIADADDDLHAFLSLRSPQQRKKTLDQARVAYAKLARDAGIDPVQAGILPSR